MSHSRWLSLHGPLNAAKLAVVHEHVPLLNAEHFSRAHVRTHNHIVVMPSSDVMLEATLEYQASPDKDDVALMHIWLTESTLVTWLDDEQRERQVRISQWQPELDKCDNAPEMFCVLLSGLIDHFHLGLDEFEVNLGALERRMRKNNRALLMQLIFERRHDLLYWSRLYLPIVELHIATKEAFLGAVTERRGFVRLGYKLERVRTLLSAYDAQIDTLISMDVALSSYRGNDIMKTLTIFTAVFTPAMVIGGIWGMNFADIPLFRWHWGFAAMGALIIVSTALSYWWLWRKGWTGDLLKRRPGE